MELAMVDDTRWVGAKIEWQRRGRVRLRRLSSADLGLLSQARGATMGRAQIFEAWPKPASVDALMREYPELQLAVEVDQRVVGGLLCQPVRSASAEVLHPWSRREPLVARAEEKRSSGEEVLRGTGAVLLASVSAREAQMALRVGRQLLVQQRGAESTISVVRSVGWRDWSEARGPVSAEAYLQQVHARAVEDARLSVFLDAGYVMRGYWQVGDAIDVMMCWTYRAH
ncbi:hypothetical protein DN745_15010 [Bradymonas sediminis]|uniref:N-acetyltransferase domain-containing protein n=2 Tax=Bradymonas sediminis TaxID=1548548 RepID=A0A2Z4FP89_9DELT|nr:hypothetical protein DN745_15010 [Bradymonas sediminis]